MDTDGPRQVCKMPRALEVKMYHPRTKGSSYFSKGNLLIRFPLSTHPKIGTDRDV